MNHRTAVYMGAFDSGKYARVMTCLLEIREFELDSARIFIEAKRKIEIAARIFDMINLIVMIFNETEECNGKPEK